MKNIRDTSSGAVQHVKRRCLLQWRHGGFTGISCTRRPGSAGFFSEKRLTRTYFFTAGVYEEGSFVSMEFDQKIWGALPLIVRGMYRVGCLFDKAAHLFVQFPATKAIFSGIQADLSSTPQINFADSSNSQSVMPVCVLQGR
jgi:hypothetical protein